MTEIKYTSQPSDWAAQDPRTSLNTSELQPAAAAMDSHESSVAAALLEVLETVILTLVIFFLVRMVIMPYRIEGDSMLPNYQNTEQLIINKLAYRFGKPQRGDVIVFHYPRDPSRDFIKRVVGLPGETVEVRWGQVFIDGQLLEEDYPLNMGRYNADPITLGPDELYVLGDNRDYSSDSHYWGPLPIQNVVGEAWITYVKPEWRERYPLLRLLSPDAL